MTFLKMPNGRKKTNSHNTGINNHHMSIDCIGMKILRHDDLKSNHPFPKSSNTNMSHQLITRLCLILSNVLKYSKHLCELKKQFTLLSKHEQKAKGETNEYQCNSSKSAFVSQRAYTNHFTIHGHCIRHTAKQLNYLSSSTSTKSKGISNCTKINK